MAYGLLALAALLALGALQFLNSKSAAPDRIDSAEPAAIANSRKTAPALGTGFDFYVLALSWSPSYCASKGSSADAQQCRLAKPMGFTVHGLWPQFERGFPVDCSLDASRDLDRMIVNKIKPIMPSASLARYEWRKHGTCSGLDQKNYFDTLLAAFSRIRIPDIFRAPAQTVAIAPNAVEAAFVKSNPGMQPAGIAVICDKHYLGEVRICLNKDLTFRTCREVDRRACNARTAEMPPLR